MTSTSCVSAILMQVALSTWERSPCTWPTSLPDLLWRCREDLPVLLIPVRIKQAIGWDKSADAVEGIWRSRTFQDERVRGLENLHVWWDPAATKQNNFCIGFQSYIKWMQAPASHVRHFGLSGDDIGGFQAVSTGFLQEVLHSCSALASTLHKMQCCAARAGALGQHVQAQPGTISISSAFCVICTLSLMLLPQVIIQ